LVRVDRAFEIPAANGQLTIVRNDLEYTYNVSVTGVCSFQR